MLDAAKFRSHNWENTPLGPMEQWSRELNILIDFLLCSQQPMYILWGPERAFVFNGPYMAIWGIRTLDRLGGPIAKVAGGHWEGLRPMVEQVFAGESFSQTDYSINARPGVLTRYFDLSYTPIHDFNDRNKVAGALCICNDVTNRHLNAEEIRETRETLALAVENVTEGVALVDKDLSLIVWNEPFRLHFGYEEGQLTIGMSALDLMLETAMRGELGRGDPYAIVEALAHSIRTAEHAALEIQRGNGVILRLSRRRLSGGRHLLVSRDITEERAAARLKDELVSTVSHELRTPLTAISGALGIVSAGAAGELSEKAERLVKIAQRNSERLITLVNDLLDIDKLHSSYIDFRFQEENLVDIVLSAVEQNQPYAERGGLGLRADVPAGSIPITVDRNRIVQVLTNLISNAVKFSPEGEEVVVRLRADGQTARISVIDHGPGVPPTFRSKMFMQFTQYDASSSRGQQGTGLGLAITKSIVEHHGGTISLDEEVLEGATFHVDLPLAG